MPTERAESGEPGSVSRWIPALQRGDQRAVQALWEYCFEPLARLAAARLRGAPCRAGDGEDVAVEAFLSFCTDVQEPGRFPDLASRANLMRLLVRFTICKAFDFRAREDRRHQAVRGDSVLSAAIEYHAGEESPPEFQAQVASLLRKLPDQDLRAIAHLRMEGHTNAEIARQLHCSRSTVELKVARIRGYWKADWADLKGQTNEEEPA